MRSGFPCRVLRGCSLAAFLCVTAAGCARHPRGTAQAPTQTAYGGESAVGGVITVSVENHNWSDVVVSLVRNGHTHRLGTVTGASNAVLRFPAYYGEASAPLQLMAHPIGDPTVFRSERFVVMPGQQVTWTLENSLVRSSLAIY
jgi:hypothetical protein